MNTNIIEDYMNKVFTTVILVITGTCLCTGVTFLALKSLGFYPTVSWIALGIFIGSCIIYFLIGLWFISHSYATDDNGERFIIPTMFKAGKIFTCVMLLIQFNYIVYLIPTRQFWAYTFFFLILISFFLDLKLTATASIGILISLLISSLIRMKETLPVRDDYFIPELIIRTFGLIISIAGILLITYFVGHHLVHMKNQEIIENNSRVEKILASATSLVENLSKTSIGRSWLRCCRRICWCLSL